ncbi:hypothetical protein LshimejAT787_1101210 [Lyophyllum shimeji]|uniref:Uncharacterized protein n=1 Tax=Lyophyllum shimeji TaxID=47721 RepID=A0A9P3PVR6_LYOSH|nr:hypothetical protein LshimejAT787_1101210 [Lyophyllum shimeji]
MTTARRAGAWLLKTAAIFSHASSLDQRRASRVMVRRLGPRTRRTFASVTRPEESDDAVQRRSDTREEGQQIVYVAG